MSPVPIEETFIGSLGQLVKKLGDELFLIPRTRKVITESTTRKGNSDFGHIVGSSDSSDTGNREYVYVSMTSRGSHELLQGTRRREERDESCEITTVVGETSLIVWIGITVTDSAIARREC